MQSFLFIDDNNNSEPQTRNIVIRVCPNAELFFVSSFDESEKILSGQKTLPVVFINACNLEKALVSLSKLKSAFLGIKIIFMSKSENPSDIKFAINHQANGFIKYPLDPIEFREILSALDPYSYIGNETINSISRAEQNELIKKKLINDAAKLIENDLDKDISLDYIAAKLGLSPCYLSSLFHKITGQNFMSYVTDLRLTKATHLLETTNYPVNKVASMVGYHNPPYFSTIFKKKYGFIPSKLRSINIIK